MAADRAPPSPKPTAADLLTNLLHEILHTLLEQTGAKAGWLAEPTAGGGNQVIVQAGAVEESWLRVGPVSSGGWGIRFENSPIAWNDPARLPWAAEPLPQNLLIQVLADQQAFLVLANKTGQFKAEDERALVTAARLVEGLRTHFADPASALSSDSLARCLCEHTESGLTIHAADGQLLFANTRWCEWTGFALEELCLCRPPLPFWVTPQDLAALSPSAIPTSLQSPTRAPGCLPFRHRNHSLFWCQMETAVVRGERRQLTVCFYRRWPDRRSETSIVGDAGSFQAVLDQWPHALALTDRSGCLLWGNDAFRRDVLQAEVSPGQPLASGFEPASAAVLERIIRQSGEFPTPNAGQCCLKRLTASGEASAPLIAYWQRLRHPQGAEFLFAFAENWDQFAPVANARLARLPAAPLWPMSGRVLLLTVDGRVEWWDEQWEAETGLRREEIEAATTELVLDWLLPQHRDREAVSAHLIQVPRQPWQELVEVSRPDGSQTMRWTGLPIGPAPRELSLSSPWPWSIGGLGNTWLIIATAPHQVHSQQAAVQGYLRQLLRGLSHLLNNYLTVPIGLSDLCLARPDLPADLPVAFQQILDSCQRAARLISALQDLAAESVGEVQVVGLTEILRETVAEFSVEMPQYRSAIHLDAPAVAPRVRVNVGMMRRVLRNLLTNAAHAMATIAKPALALRVGEAGGMAHCEIEDNGEGFSIADWAAAPGPFYSTKGPFARESRHAVHDAHGLGLAVARHLLALHGGRLDLFSRPGEGTRAVIRLPIVADPPSAGESLRANAR